MEQPAIVRRARSLPSMIGAAILAGLVAGWPAHAVPTSKNTKCEQFASPPGAVIEACNAALENPPPQPAEHAVLLLARGLAELSAHEEGQAVADFNQAVDIEDKLQSPDDPRARVALANARAYRGTALLRQGQVDPALADLDAALELMPDYPAALWERALAWHQKGRTDRALADLNEAIRIRPSWVPPYVTRGAAEADQGDSARAIADYDEAIRRDPRNVGAYFNRGVELNKKGDYPGAIADFDDAVKLQPNDSAIFGSRAVAWANEGNLEKALADFTTEIELRATGHAGLSDEAPSDASQRYTEALSLRAGIYIRLGNFVAAKADADRAAQVAPAMPATWMASTWNEACWARALADVELATALEDCDRAVQLAPSVVDRAAFLDSRAVVRYRRGEFDLAVADENAAIAAAPDKAEPAYRFVRGLAEERLGKSAEGRADIAAALAAEPKLAERYAGWGLRPDR